MNLPELDIDKMNNLVELQRQELFRELYRKSSGRVQDIILWDNSDWSKDTSEILDLAILRTPNLVNLVLNWWIPTPKEMDDFLETLPENQQRLEYLRSVLILVVEKFLKILNPNIISAGWFILSNEVLTRLVILTFTDDSDILSQNLIQMWQEIAISVHLSYLDSIPVTFSEKL